MIFISCGSRILTFVPASCVTPQTHPCTSYAEVNIIRIQTEQQQNCSRTFVLWRKSTFHIIPLPLKEQEGFLLTSIAVGADLSVGLAEWREKSALVSPLHSSHYPGAHSSKEARSVMPMQPSSLGGNISQQDCFQGSLYVSASLSVGELGKSKPHNLLPNLFQMLHSFVGVCTKVVRCLVSNEVATC